MAKHKLLLPLTLLAILIASLVVVSHPSGAQRKVGAPFVPPDRKTRIAAIGSLRNVPRDLRSAFTPGDDFDPIPEPGPSDWLTHHAESGQTFGEFTRGYPNRPDQKRNRLYLIPLGDFSNQAGADGENTNYAPDLKSMETFAGAFFGMKTTFLPQQTLDGLPIKQRERRGGEPQLLSTDVLSWLKTQTPDDAYCVVALTMHDLYPAEDWNFVFGQASLRDRVGVYSFARYLPSFHGEKADENTPSLVIRRSCRVLAHETGHMFGIKHCIHFHCLMNGSNHLQESDAAPIHLCPVCLRKLHSSVHFDIHDRYEKLRDFSEQAKWNEEATWIRQRIKVIE